MSVEIRAVERPGDLKAFVDLPYRLHRGTPWVPHLRLERYQFLSRRLNPYFTHGTARYFIAERNGEVVGRITAQIDFAYNEFHDARWGMFGFLEFVDDRAVVEALLDAAESWLSERGCNRMVGPMDFTMNDESGVLIEGFDRPPMIRQPWHPPYYAQRLEEAGLGKAVDLLMWELWLDQREEVLPVIVQLGEAATSKHGVRIRKMSRRRLRREMDDFAKVYNAAWADNFGFVPYSKADLDAYAAELQLVYARDWFMVAEKDGETIAIAITVPDINQVLRKMNGRLLPFGWWHFLNKNRIMKTVRVGFLGVMPDQQHTGVAAALYLEHFDMADKTPQKGGEMGWILETNEAMNRGMEAMGAKVVKRYRVYERLLAEGAE